jgi:hypothetical protein
MLNDFQKFIYLNASSQRKLYKLPRAALRIAAVILFERYEQKDKSGKPDPAPSRGNAQIKTSLVYFGM